MPNYSLAASVSIHNLHGTRTNIDGVTHESQSLIDCISKCPPYMATINSIVVAPNEIAYYLLLSVAKDYPLILLNKFDIKRCVFNNFMIKIKFKDELPFYLTIKQHIDSESESNSVLIYTYAYDSLLKYAKSIIDMDHKCLKAIADAIRSELDSMDQTRSNSFISGFLAGTPCSGYIQNCLGELI